MTQGDTREQDRSAGSRVQNAVVEAEPIGIGK